MIERNASSALRLLAGQYPVVTVTGPRQSGKTTLCRALFPTYPWVNLEPIDTRQAVQRDPRGFLAQPSDGVIIAEVQHAPDLLSYIQAVVDDDDRAGRFILTGSQHFGLSEAIAQSLAGRTAVFQLLPPALDELRRFPNGAADLLTTLWRGAYPRIFYRGIEPSRWYADYVTTYVERDVRQVANVTDLESFATFLRLCAGRTPWPSTSRGSNLPAQSRSASSTVAIVQRQCATPRSWAGGTFPRPTGPTLSECGAMVASMQLVQAPWRLARRMRHDVLPPA